MRRFALTLLYFLLAAPVAVGAEDGPELRATYEMYAAGLHVAEISVLYSLGPAQYSIEVAFHTTGLVSVFRHGHQMNSVAGIWSGGQPHPERFEGDGVWQGEDNATLIDYTNGQPVIEHLVSPMEDKREPVPAALEANSIDTLSALALLVRRVENTGRCEASAHTFDGRRVSDISARTVGEEILDQSDLSIFNGKTLRCDFIGQMVAGFLYRDDTAADRRPLHGSAWLATLVPGTAPVPVRMDFETRWFGDAHMYLTHLQSEPATVIAVH